MPKPADSSPDTPLFSRPWRLAGYFLLLAVLGAGFAAYQHPMLILQWETLMALCGLG
ncbi:hypothetical protein [Pigmentiphaga aceris]|uniref:hypothetical protein n=1 Tax=Pigmentiphaga aceris TaxID=1940612 RepID=UPI00165265DA|nr:hypothetical protein [Pigmentiphaga aceris]